MPEKTEKRRKITSEDIPDSEQDCDNIIVVMDGREKQSERLLEDALDGALAVFALSDSQIETLEAENDFDEMRLHNFFQNHPPAKTKSIKTEHGSFGYKIEAAQYSIEKNKESFQTAMDRAAELEDLSITTKDPTINAMLKAEAKIIRDTFSRATEAVEKISFAIIRKNLKSLSEETLKTLGVEVTPEVEKFFVQFGAGKRSAAQKAMRALIETLKKNQDSA